MIPQIECREICLFFSPATVSSHYSTASHNPMALMLLYHLSLRSLFTICSSEFVIRSLKFLCVCLTLRIFSRRSSMRRSPLICKVPPSLRRRVGFLRKAVFFLWPRRLLLSPGSSSLDLPSVSGVHSLIPQSAETLDCVPRAPHPTSVGGASLPSSPSTTAADSSEELWPWEDQQDAHAGRRRR